MSNARYRSPPLTRADAWSVCEKVRKLLDLKESAVTLEWDEDAADVRVNVSRPSSKDYETLKREFEYLCAMHGWRLPTVGPELNYLVVALRKT